MALTARDSSSKVVVLDGSSLTIESLLRVGRGMPVVLSDEARERVARGREVVQKIVDEGEMVYGVNTGFGHFAKVRVNKEDICALQLNLIRSHAAGTGVPLTVERTRRLLCVRINVLAKGRSGISQENLDRLVQALNSNCMSYVPSQGTLGASGDLAPLAHLTLGLLGEGKLWDPLEGHYLDASSVLRKYGLEPLSLGAKEGLALINGTQLISSLLAEAVSRSERVAQMGEIAAALTHFAVNGIHDAYCKIIHEARVHRGQIESAAFMRSLVGERPTDDIVKRKHIQDAYSLRCVPQVQGIVRDTIEFAKRILTVELNAATDNPMVFSETGEVLSGGNFHGEYPAKAGDFLGIAVHEVAQISERRIERLCNQSLSGLPAFLVPNGGLNSGMMIAQCTAAALVSENKVLVHPSSADSISTSAAQEDHVSMGGYAARKALNIVENVEKVVAIELLCAAQGVDLRLGIVAGSEKVPLTEELMERYNAMPPALRAVHARIRKNVEPLYKDRYLHPDIEAVHDLVTNGDILNEALRFIQPQDW